MPQLALLVAGCGIYSRGFLRAPITAARDAPRAGSQSLLPGNWRVDKQDRSHNRDQCNGTFHLCLLVP
jgi:hypothetical protein